MSVTRDYGQLEREEVIKKGRIWIIGYQCQEWLDILIVNIKGKPGKMKW